MSHAPAAEADQYPESTKLAAIAPTTQAIGEFVDWLHTAKGIVLAIHRTSGVTGHSPLAAIGTSVPRLLAEWAGIDENKIETERRAMLDAIRAANQKES